MKRALILIPCVFLLSVCSLPVKKPKPPVSAEGGISGRDTIAVMVDSLFNWARKVEKHGRGDLVNRFQIYAERQPATLNKPRREIPDTTLETVSFNIGGVSFYEKMVRHGFITVDRNAKVTFPGGRTWLVGELGSFSGHTPSLAEKASFRKIVSEQGFSFSTPEEEKDVMSIQVTHK